MKVFAYIKAPCKDKEFMCRDPVRGEGKLSKRSFVVSLACKGARNN